MFASIRGINEYCWYGRCSFDVGIAKALGLQRGEVERFKTLEVDIAFKMGTVITWSVRYVYLGFLGEICVFGIPRWKVCVRTGDPKMSAPQVVPLRFGITSALPSTPWASTFSVCLGTISGWSVVDKGQECAYLAFLRWRVCVRTGDPKMSAPQVVPLRFAITSALPSTPWASMWRVCVRTGPKWVLPR